MIKECPTCKRTYPDSDFAFCLADGALLSAPFDPQATLVLSNAAPTEPTRIPPTTFPPTALAPSAPVGEPAMTIAAVAPTDSGPVTETAAGGESVPDLGWLLRRHGFEVVVGAGVLWILGGVGLYRVEPRGAWPNFIAVGVALLVVGLSLKIGVADRVKTSTYQPRAERSERWLRFWRVRIPVLIGLGVACVGGAIVAKEEFGNPQAAVLFVCALTFGWLVAWMEGRGKSN